MTDPRTVLCETLAHQLLITRQARDTLWDDYWQRRRVVVVPDNGNQSVKEGDAHHAVSGELQRLRSGPADLTRPGDEPGRGIAGQPDRLSTMQASVVEMVARNCIVRLKAAREKDAVNKNLSTLLAVVVKVQRDLEALLNGQRTE